MGGGWQTKFNVSPGPGLWSLVLGPFGPDQGPDLDLTWDLDLSLTKNLEGNLTQNVMLQENWFYVLEKELEKVTSFYREKNAEAMRKFNTLKEQLSVTEEPNMRNNQV